MLPLAPPELSSVDSKPPGMTARFFPSTKPLRRAGLNRSESRFGAVETLPVLPRPYDAEARHSWPVIPCLDGNSEQAWPGSGTIAEADRDDRLRAGCRRRHEDGERGQELRTVDRSLHPHHRERDRNLRRSRHRDRYRMVYLSPTAAADIRAGRRRLQDPHRPITLARPRDTRGGRYR